MPGVGGGGGAVPDPKKVFRAARPQGDFFGLLMGMLSQKSFKIKDPR